VEEAERESRGNLWRVRGSAVVYDTTPPAAWLAWNGGAVGKMAQAIYDDRAFHDLPILADALEEAGCTDAALLGHLRSAGPHVRGCWGVDAVLGKA
jgi:hypothetical protein